MFSLNMRCIMYYSLLMVIPATGYVDKQIRKQAHRSAQPTITVVGTGYVGLVTGTGLAEFGNNVICADIDAKKIALLNEGIIPIYEPDLEQLVNKNVTSGRLVFTDNVDDALSKAAIIFIAVGTPMAEDGAADLSYVDAVIDAIARTIGDNCKLICTKSTVPVGTGARIRQRLENHGINPQQFSIVSNPEFLREGSAVKDFLEPDRIVIGIESSAAFSIMCDIYQALIAQGTPYVATTVPTAETIKYASNAFLAVKLSFINEIANLCDLTGADVEAVSFAMGLDKRIGKLFLNPGPGFGGSCFPKDSQALMYTGQELGIDLKLVEASLVVNEHQKTVPVQKLLNLMNNDLQGKKIAVLGLAFKANTDDVRYSPAITTIKKLQECGADVCAYDPVATDNMRKLIPDIVYCDTCDDALQDADGVIIMTEWQEFKELTVSDIANLVRQRVLVDARNIVDATELRNNDFAYAYIGRPGSNNQVQA